jgi:hypothetical protein
VCKRELDEGDFWNTGHQHAQIPHAARKGVPGRVELRIFTVIQVILERKEREVSGGGWGGGFVTFLFY